MVEAALRVGSRGWAGVGSHELAVQLCKLKGLRALSGQCWALVAVKRLMHVATSCNESILRYDEKRGKLSETPLMGWQ